MRSKLFSFKGRATRSACWLAHIPLLIFLGLTNIYMYGMPALGIPARMQTASFSQSLKTGKIRIAKIDRAQLKRQNKINARRFLSLFLTVLGMAAPFWVILISVTTRRLHDRNKSGLWQLLLYLPLPVILLPLIFVALGFEFPTFLQQDGFNGIQIHTLFMIACTFISTILSIKYIVELGFFGPRGGSPNKYGIDPRTT